MVLGSLALTISACLSGGYGQFATANRIAAIKQHANEIIMRAAVDFDYTDYDLTYNEQQSFTQQKLYDYAVENDLFTTEELNRLKETITNNDAFACFDDIENLFVQQSVSDDASLKKAIDVNSQNLYKDFAVAGVPGTAKIDNSLINNNFVDIGLAVGGNESSSEKTDTTESEGEVTEATSEKTEPEEFKLPILPYNANNISSSIGGKVDGCVFFGILCSKDACINLYNAFAGWTNKQVMYQVSGSGSPFKIIVEAFKTLATTTAIGAAFATVVAGAIATVTGALSSVWASFCALFAAGGPIGIILGLIIGLIGAACIGTVVSMIVYGYLGKGFAVGWKIHNIFRWEWFCGELN